MISARPLSRFSLVCYPRKKQAHLQPGDPADWGDAWIWRALALPSHLRVVTHLSHERSEEEATAFLAAFKARTDGHAPLFTSEKLPAYVTALMANYSTPEPPPAQRGRGRPRQTPRRVLDTALLYAQVDKRREQGRVVEVRRRLIFGARDIITEVLGDQQINTAYVARDNLTSRQSIGRLVRKTLSHSKKSFFLRRHLALEDAVFNFVPRIKRCASLFHNPRWGANGSNEPRRWQQSSQTISGVSNNFCR